LQHLYPKSQIDVHVIVLEDAGSVLAAALTCAGLALADASIHMFDVIVGASSVKLIDNNVDHKHRK
jgi:exosome complex component MTR3